MLSVFSLFFSIFFLSTSFAGPSEPPQCHRLFIMVQNDTIAPTQASGKAAKVARLLTAPAKISTGIPYQSIDKDFLDANVVLREAKLEQQRQREIPKTQLTHGHIEFLARQLPIVTQLLDQIAASDRTKSYYQVSKEGEREKKSTTVEDVVTLLKNQSQEALQKNTVTSEFFTTFVVDVLGLHYALWQGIDFNRVEDFDRHQGYLRAQARRPKGFNNDLMAPTFDLPTITPLIRFLTKMVEVKRKIHTQARDGILLWPTFASLTSEDFQDWHLGIKPVAISLDRVLYFDGNISDFFGLLTHDVTNHTPPLWMAPHREKFSKFKDTFFQKIANHPKVRAEILRKIWFISTHEGSQPLYFEYLTLSRGGVSSERALKSLTATLQSSVTASEITGEGAPILVTQLQSHLYFYPETSRELRALGTRELTYEVQEAWAAFQNIYKETVEIHFSKR